MIAQSTIQAIRDLPIDSTIGKYVELKKRGITHVGLSPFNDEKTGSFYVHPVKGFWKDFSSGKGGRDVISFLMQKEGIEFVDAVKLAAQDHGIQIEYDNAAGNKEYHEAIEKRKQLTPVLEWAFSEFQKNEVPEDFLQRFTTGVCESFHIGYCTGLIPEAAKAGIDVKKLHEGGLVNKNPARDEYFEKFKDRVIFPAYDWRGTLVGFTGRFKGTPPPEVPKYLHSSFEKSKTLYGLPGAIKSIQERETAYVVEGPTDTMRHHQFDLTNTVGKQGSDFSDDQAKLLKRFCGTVCFVPDNDCDKPKNAGMESLERNADVALKAGLSVKVLIPGTKI